MRAGADDPAQPATIASVIERMTRIGDDLRDDPRRYFHDTYQRTTVAVGEAVRAGSFLDADWVERWDVVFAELYLDALGDWRAGRPTPEPWRIAFEAGDGPRLPPVRLVLLGMNAHINYDLPQALVSVISPQDFAAPAVLARREQDHRRIDEILAGRVAAEDRELALVERPGDRTVLDRLLQPFNRLGTRKFLAEARRKVWHNANVLSEAESDGTVDRRLAELEHLAAKRIDDLLAPGQVLLELARRGFGIELER